MSGVTHYPNFEPLMSGALQDIEMDEDAPSNVPTSVLPHHIPGTFPDSPAPPALPSTELPTSDSQDTNELATPHDLKPDEPATLDDQAADEVATPRSEASDEPDIPEVQPTIQFPLQPMQKADNRPRNYKGELLDDWQIKICKEFQAIHPPPKKIRQQAAVFSEQPQGPNTTGLIGSNRPPLTNGSPINDHQQREKTAIGLNDSHRSPMANVPSAVAARTIDWHESTTGLLHQPHGTTSIGSNDSHRSPLDPYRATSEVLDYPHALTSIGSSDLHRSPLEVHRATTEALDQPRETTSFGSNDLYRSPLADVSSMRGSNAMNDSHNQPSDISHEASNTAIVGLINSLQHPLAALSSKSSPCGIKTIALTDSPQILLEHISPTHTQPGSYPAGLNVSPGSPLAASYMEPAVDAITDTHRADPDVSKPIQSETPVTLRSPPMAPLATMTTVPAKPPSRWSIQSLYARVQGKPKKRSPLCERVNNGNIHKVPKTPKKVTWPENGPVTGTKRFMKNEAMSHPSPTSSREHSSILSSVPSDFSPQPSPTMQEEEGQALLSRPYQAYPPDSAVDGRSLSPISSNHINVLNPASTIEYSDAGFKPSEEHTINSSLSSDNEASIQSVVTPTKTVTEDPSTPPSHLFPKFEELTISTRRSSLRRREKEDQAQKLRDAVAAEEKARKEKEEAEEKARKDREEAEERARIKAEQEEEQKKTGSRRVPLERVIQSLPPGWDEKVRINMAKGMREQLAMTSVGNPLTRRDFGMVLPQPGTGDDPSGWLNDEIISGYLQAVVDHGHRVMGHPRGAKPRMHAFSPFFYTTLKERGYDAVKRWPSRAKIGGNDLKTVEYVFIPCNPTRSHWTLVVVSPVRKTIEVFDSMHGASLDKVNTTKSWLRGELGRSYVDSEWTVVEDPIHPGRGKGPVQNNANDCGVFAVTTAKMLVLGVDPMAVSAKDMPLQRCRLVAELLNGGFSGEFEPRIVFE